MQRMQRQKKRLLFVKVTVSRIEQTKIYFCLLFGAADWHAKSVQTDSMDY